MIIGVAMFIDGEVQSLPKPNRHFNLEQKFPSWEHKHGDKGFLDDEHGFVSRRAALGIAQDQGQLKGRKLTAEYHGLFSEDLW